MRHGGTKCGVADGVLAVTSDLGLLLPSWLPHVGYLASYPRQALWVTATTYDCVKVVFDLLPRCKRLITPSIRQFPFRKTTLIEQPSRRLPNLRPDITAHEVPLGVDAA